jgi:actin-related protein
MPFSQLAEPCETTFFGSQYESTSFDSHEQPIPELIYRALLDLPLDVRAICMARIIFTGSCAKILGLRSRLFNELSRLVEQRGWERVRGKAVEALRTNPKLRRRASSQAQADGSGPTPALEDESIASPTTTTAAAAAPGAEIDGVWDDAAPIAAKVGPSSAPVPPDPIEAQFLQRRGIASPTQLSQLPQPSGILRAIESLGPWAGASLLASLKTPVVATVERDAWLAQGLHGASRPQDIPGSVSGAGLATTARTRQSMGAGRQSGVGIGVQPWTLGAWGAN